MTKLVPITIACGLYDRTRAIMDGRVRVDGCDVTFLPLEPEELFFRAFRYHEFDVAEISFNSYLMQTSRVGCPYIAIPAFVSRHFRHSAIFIRTDRGIRAPADLKGRLVGLPEYQQTANVWMRGILQGRVRRRSVGHTLADRRAGGAGTRRAHALAAQARHRT